MHAVEFWCRKSTANVCHRGVNLANDNLEKQKSVLQGAVLCKLPTSGPLAFAVRPASVQPNELLLKCMSPEVQKRGLKHLSTPKQHLAGSSLKRGAEGTPARLCLLRAEPWPLSSSEHLAEKNTVNLTQRTCIL